MYFVRLFLLLFGIMFIAHGISNRIIWASAIGGFCLGLYHSLSEGREE